MKHRLAPLALVLMLPFAAPVAAEESAPEDGYSLMEEGARLFMRGILSEMEPALSDLRDLASELEPKLHELIHEMGPAFTELLGMVDDFGYYEPPVLLPNGDIILRRKPDAPEWVPPEPADPDAPEVEL